MGILIQGEELRRLRETPTAMQQRLCRLIGERTEKNTVEDCWVQPGDTQEWYHLCWERMRDAAFWYCYAKGENLGKWIHHRTMELVRMDTDGWIGPWYRNRSDPKNPVGALETAHITLAVCEAYDNCKDLFSKEEQEEILTAFREKGLPLCRAFVQQIYARKENVNNWHIVLLDGYTAAAVMLGEEQEIRNAMELAAITAGFFNEDSYGESVQYSNYAAIHQSFLYELLIRSGYGRAAELQLACYGNLMEWYAASFLHRKPIGSMKGELPRTVNFGDSAAIFRPSGDILTQVAVRLKEALPRQAGLASWLLETTYNEEENLPDELASFGFFNQFHYHTLLMQPDMCPPLSPQAAGVPLNRRFCCGHILARDGWEEPQATLAISAGYDSYNVTSHRHADQNSFQLIVGKERMLIDPGHCCYRLEAQKRSAADLAHNTIQLKKNGIVLPQKSVSGNLFHRKTPDNQLLVNEAAGDAHIVVSDMAGLYDECVKRAVRIWVFRLPHMIFVGDVILSEEPVVLRTQFNLNNRENLLRTHIYNEHRLVFRRGEEAIKLFEVSSKVDGVEQPSKLRFDWSYVHDYYHPLPNQAGQGKEGSALTYIWEGETGKSHVRLHTIAADREEKIKGWHVLSLEDGFTRIEAPGGSDWMDVQLTADRVELRSPQTGIRYFSF